MTRFASGSGGGRHDDALWCIDEDWPGYKQIVGGIEALTEGAWPGRFPDVAFPPFAYNWTQLRLRTGSGAIWEDPRLIWLRPPENADPIG